MDRWNQEEWRLTACTPDLVEGMCDVEESDNYEVLGIERDRNVNGVCSGSAGMKVRL